MAFTGNAPNPEDFTPGGQSTADESLLVKFVLRPLEDAAESQRQGRPIFRDVEFIDIRTPGDRDPVVRRATQQDAERFPRHYAAFKNRVEGDIVEGTPLTEWPLISRSVVEELAFFNVRTVEGLVAMSDANSQNFMAINSLKEKAKQWLSEASERAKANELTEALAQRDATIEALTARLDALEAGKPEPKATKKKAAKKKASAKKE